AEAALHTALGIADFTFGATPRVAVQASFERSLRFNDPVEVELAVAALGRTSVEYRLAIAGEAGTPAGGTGKTCPIDPGPGRAVPRPDANPAALAGGGRQRAPGSS